MIIHGSQICVKWLDHHMRARCITVLLTQKLVQIGWKPMFWFQSIACKLYNLILISLSKEGETQKNVQISSEPHIAAAVTKEFQKIYETAVWSLLSLNDSEQCWNVCPNVHSIHAVPFHVVPSLSHTTLFILGRWDLLSRHYTWKSRSVHGSRYCWWTTLLTKITFLSFFFTVCLGKKVTTLDKSFRSE